MPTKAELTHYRLQAILREHNPACLTRQAAPFLNVAGRHLAGAKFFVVLEVYSRSGWA